MKNRPLLRWLLVGQAVYFLITGIWPFVSASTFQRVTGPKVDFWLVKMVGLLVSVNGAVLLAASRRASVAPETRMVAVGSAAALAAVDVAYVAKKRISPVYLLDALAELALLAGWGLVSLRKK